VSSVVLDASAVLAFVLKERGSDVVRSRMNGGIMSAVNFSEVLKKSIEYGGSAAVTRCLLERAQVKVIPFDESQAVETAALFPVTRNQGLSFADRVCLALAARLKTSLYTADHRVAEAGVDVKIVMIRQPAKAKSKAT
jgi:PIN domain nuclease of toxin-antitoxin system